MRADSVSHAISAACHVGVNLNGQQIARLERFYGWLADEAIPAGGLGPNERRRLWQRHIADSLLFGIELADGQLCLDIGTGVGLPGIPLAVAFPDIAFTLLDRSGRRAHLVRRALAILRLENCTVVQADITEIDYRFDRIVSRASLPPEELMIHVKHLLKHPGIAIVGYSRRKKCAKIASSVDDLQVSVVEIPLEVLDSVATLLRIEAT